MARPATATHWIEDIRAQRANFPRKTVEQIRDSLPAGTPDDPQPGERTVRKYIAEFDELPDGDKAPYRVLRWPESFEAHLLPWEAAPIVAPLLAEFLAAGRRPLVRLAIWYWRASLFAPPPSADHANHLLMARMYTINEVLAAQGFRVGRMGEGIALRLWTELGSAAGNLPLDHPEFDSIWSGVSTEGTVS